MRIKPSTSLTGLLAIAVLAFMAIGCQPAEEGGTGGDTGTDAGTTAPETDSASGMEGASNEGTEDGGKAEMHWAADFDEAMTKAKDEDKMVFIKFTADWCGPCHLMEDEALSDGTIVGDLEKVSVPVHIDIDAAENKELVKKYLVDPNTQVERGIPYAVMLDGDGKVVADMMGYGGKMAFHAWVRDPKITTM